MAFRTALPLVLQSGKPEWIKLLGRANERAESQNWEPFLTNGGCYGIILGLRRSEICLSSFLLCQVFVDLKQIARPVRAPCVQLR